MPNIRVSLSIGYPAAVQEGEIEVDNDEWNDCETEDERQNLINSYWKEWANTYIDGDAELIEE